jgi:hypothetical protein
VPGALGADLAQLLDVDVDQLARALSLIAIRRLDRLQSREPAEADPPQPTRDGRERQTEALCDLSRGHPQASQRLDRLDAVCRQLRGPRLGRRTAVEQARLSLGSPAGEPLGGGAPAHSGGLGRLREQPLSFEALYEQAPAFRAGTGITVQLHPVSSLSLGGSTPPAFKEARMNNVVRNYS